MQAVIQIAKYFLSKDPDRQLFNKTLVHKNGRDFYEGNARLNKYLHLAQNIFIAKTGTKLFQEDLYAYDNGAVALDVQENYAILLSKNSAPCLSPEISDFLDRIFKVFENASLDELIELSHEDSEWVDKHGYYSKPDQRMNSMARASEYQEQYHDILVIMDRMMV